MKRIFIAGLAVVAAACSDSPVASSLESFASSANGASDRGFAVVTNSDDAGPGSFRAAVQQANADPSIGRIKFAGRREVRLESSVEYTGARALTIDGTHATIDGSALASGDAFRATGGGDLTVKGLVVRNAPESGINVEVPSTSTGLTTVTLHEVQIVGNRGHGVVVNDQAAPDEAGNPDASPPIPPNMAGSAASVRVVVTGSRFEANGFGAIDRDGLRINEGDDGELTVSITGSRATGNGADGIELDERGSGSVSFVMANTQLSGNGSFTTVDLDDGIDVDEAGPGDLIGSVTSSSASDNFEEGFDLNENDAGDFRVDMTDVEASRNREEGLDFEEDDDFAGGGNLITTLVDVTANGNAAGDAGLKIREKGVGDLDADLTRVTASNNLTSGVQVREDAAGSMRAAVRGTIANANSSHGIDFDENAAGNLTASVEESSSTNNGGFGVRADNAGAGTGTLLLRAVQLTGHASGPVGGGGVTVTTLP